MSDSRDQPRWATAAKRGSSPTRAALSALVVLIAACAPDEPSFDSNRDSGAGGTSGSSGMAGAGTGGQSVDGSSGSAGAPSGTTLWAARFDGSEDRDRASGNVVSDPSGRSFATLPMQNASGDLDLALMGWDAAGKVESWAPRLFGDSAPQLGHAVALAPGDGLYVAGEGFGAVQMGGGSVTAPSGITRGLLARVTSAGGSCAECWLKGFGSWVLDVESDAEGNVYAAGGFADDLDLGDGVQAMEGFDAFVVKFSPSGDVIWKYLLQGSLSETIGRIAVHEDGSVVFGGTQRDPADLEGSISRDLLWGRIRPDGSDAGWRVLSNPDRQDSVRDVAVAPNGDAVLVGEVSSDSGVDFGCGALSTDGHNVFVVRLDSLGGCLWSRTYGGRFGQFAFGVSLLGAGDIVVVGGFDGDVDFGGGVIVDETELDGGPISGLDGFAVRLTGEKGDHVWTRHYRATGHGFPHGLHVAPSGDLYLIGSFEQSLDLGNGWELEAQGVFDQFVARLTP